MSNHNEAGSPTRRDEGSSAGCLALQSGEEVTSAKKQEFKERTRYKLN